MNTAAIIAYLEDAPLAPEVDGRGLSRVNSALLAGIAKPGLPVLLAQTHGWRPATMLDPRFRAATCEIGKPWRLLLKLSGRLPGLVAAPLRRLALVPLIKPARRHSGGWLFAPVGTDIGTADHALALAGAAGLRCALYFVDDIVAAAEAQGLPAARLGALARRVDRAVRSADRIFTITAALGAVFAQRHQTGFSELPLPFEAHPPLAAQPRGREVIHIGAINHIYAAGLLKLAKGMAAANAAGLGLCLRLTSDPTAGLRAELEALVPVKVVGVNGPGALEGLLAGALCAAVPVEGEPSGMYATSFPSKLLEYLNAAPAIVVVGPGDAAAARYFSAHGLTYHARDPGAVSAILKRLVDGREDRSAQYRAVLGKAHDPAAIADLIRKELAA